MTFQEYLKSEDFASGYEGHLTGWWESEYKDKTKSDIEYNLSSNHDNGLEIERAEEFIGRKLISEEEETLNEHFIIQVTEQIEWEYEDDCDHNDTDDFLIAQCWYDTCNTPHY